MKVLIGLLFLGAAISTASAGCPSEWKEFKNKCYRKSGFHLPFQYVSDVCDMLQAGAQPVTIPDQETNDFIVSQVATGSWCWIGLNDQDDDGEWTWPDGSDVSYTNWHSGLPDGPNNNCAEINYFEHGEWANFDCTNGFYLICETDAE